MAVTGSTSLHRGGLSCLNSSLAVASVLLTVLHLFCTSSGGGRGW